MRNVNFFYPEVFERKFNRNPKQWSLEDLHDFRLQNEFNGEIIKIGGTIDRW